MAVDSSDLKIAIEKPTAWGRELTITVPAGQVERERAATATRIAQKVRLPGFRKGKVPAGVIRKRYGAAIEQEMLERVIGDAYREALKRENLQPITQANVDRVDYEAGTDLTFHVAIEVRPEIELERVGGFTVKRELKPVTDEQVDAVLQRLREQQAVWRPIEDEAVVNGDMVSVEITPLEGEGEGTPREYQLVLGEGQALPAIEDAIRTLKSGQASEFTIDLPESSDDASSETKPHRLNISLTEAKRPELPILDDEFAKSVGEFETLANLREKVTTDLQAEAEREADRDARSALLRQIVEANPFEAPGSMVEDYLGRIFPQREGDDPQRLAEVQATARPAAADAIRRLLVVERIAEMESLHATPEEVDARVNDLAERLGRPVADVKGRFTKSGRLQEIASEVTEQKVFDYLLSLSTIE
jgi:trigger factor